ncbi:inositol 1,4,5-trisphosphate receptor-interacting protein-like 1 [Heliangelus exortis]|uniref:inositol 1,4,5-trisphosphate receptor-interacting protein-like 1 n=1 Tax=Heliangelus exortis TaxID=472823 RepID=UPI003A92D1CE
MAALKFLVLTLLVLQRSPVVSDELDEEMCLHMQEREEMLNREVTRLLRDLDQKTQEQNNPEHSGFAWGALLFPALQQWKVQAIAGFQVLFYMLLWWFMKSNREPGHSSHEEDLSNNRDQVEEQQEQQQEEEYDSDEVGRFLDEHIQWPAEDLIEDGDTVKSIVQALVLVFQNITLEGFQPVLKLPIGVGSAFEGWSHREEDIVYRLFVPLSPPNGHTFHLELVDTEGEKMERNFRIHVKLMCTCASKPQEILCFLHHPEEELRRNQKPSLLESQVFCTGSYLDVNKTARWFYQLVRASWVILPQSAIWRLKMLPFDRSCKFQMKRNNASPLTVELMFGVQQGKSNIFVGNQSAEGIFTPSTTWLETYAVAEIKFFSHIAEKAHRDSFHLKCLQICSCSLVGTGVSSYIMKTVVMHLLTIISISRWRRKHFLLRLQDIMRFLHSCLEDKCLNHFFLGNKNLPAEIKLPLDFPMAEPLNLFQHLEQDPDAHAEALRNFRVLHERFTRLLIFGR